MRLLKDTIAKTVRWQIAATMITGVTSAIKNTITYAAELDKSLTNI
jgi:hypothetical protein